MIIVGMNRTKREAKRSDDQRVSRGKKITKNYLGLLETSSVK